jgi:hypothetical protein
MGIILGNDRYDRRLLHMVINTMSDKDRLTKLDTHVRIGELKGHIVSNLFHLVCGNRELSMAEMITTIEKIALAIEKMIELRIHEKVAKD